RPHQAGSVEVGPGVGRGPGQAPPRAVLLPAAPPAALALATVGDHLHVAELPRHAVGPAVDVAVDHQAAADAGPERDHGGVAHVPRGAEVRLGPHGGGGVVVDQDVAEDAVA